MDQLHEKFKKTPQVNIFLRNLILKMKEKKTRLIASEIGYS